MDGYSVLDSQSQGKGWTVLPDPEPHGPKPAVPQHPQLPNSAATVKHSHERAPVAGPQVTPKLGHRGRERHGSGGGMAGSSRTGCSQTPCSSPWFGASFCCMTPGATARLCVSAPKFTLTFLTFSSSSFICLFWASILSSNSLILCNVQRRKILNNQNIWETKREKIPQDFHPCTWQANPTEQPRGAGGTWGCPSPPTSGASAETCLPQFL